MDLLNAEFSQIAEQVRQKKISAVEVTQFFLDRISQHNQKLNAVTFKNEKALAEAKQIDQKIAQGNPVGPLAGVPIGIKDMICTKGIASTASSKMLHNFVPPYDATLVQRLKKADAIILGKLNQDEFAMGSSNETSFYGPVKNPWNLNCTPGGSSGGSAAATAGALMPATIGTDTGGSIRQPANFCGVVGVKPTYGRISRYGVIAYASSLDQAGPITRTVKDAAILLETMSGFDPLDSTSSQQSVPAWSQLLTSEVKGMKVGVLKEAMNGSLHSDVEKTFQESVQNLKDAGAEIVEITVPFSKYSVPVYYLIASSEASSNLARYDGVKYGYRAEFKNLGAVNLNDFYSQTRSEGFGIEVKRRIMLGTYFLSSGYFEAYYQKASQIRRLLLQQFEEAFQKCDVIISPVSTSPAFRLGEKISDPVQMYLNDIFTTSANLAGVPAMSVPFGFSQEKLPIGIQILGPQFQEQKMLNIASALEESAKVKFEVAHGI